MDLLLHKSSYKIIMATTVVASESASEIAAQQSNSGLNW